MDCLLDKGNHVKASCIFSFWDFSFYVSDVASKLYLALVSKFI